MAGLGHCCASWPAWSACGSHLITFGRSVSAAGYTFASANQVGCTRSCVASWLIASKSYKCDACATQMLCKCKTKQTRKPVRKPVCW